MRISPFKLERYLELYEFTAKYMLGASDCESFELKEILSEQELSEMASLRLGYSMAQGNLRLRQEVSNLFCVAGPEDILICVPQEGIFITMNALLEPGDKVIVQVPCYQSLCELPICQHFERNEAKSPKKPRDFPKHETSKATSNSSVSCVLEQNESESKPKQRSLLLYQANV